MSEYEQQLQKIAEKFDEIRKDGTKDCKIDKTNPFDHFNAMLTEKWIRRRVEWNRLVRTYEEKKREKFRSLYEYYKTDFELKLSTKDEYALFIESDANYVVINSMYQSGKEVLMYIDAILETLKQRQWEIKNYIEYLKFTNGQ